MVLFSVSDRHSGGGEGGEGGDRSLEDEATVLCFEAQQKWTVALQ